MKLVNTEHQININFSENVQTVLVIENFNEFQKIIMHLQEQYINQYDKFYLSENGRSLSFPKFVDIVMDIFTLQLNSKKYKIIYIVLHLMLQMNLKQRNLIYYLQVLHLWIKYVVKSIVWK